MPGLAVSGGHELVGGFAERCGHQVRKLGLPAGPLPFRQPLLARGNGDQPTVQTALDWMTKARDWMRQKARDHDIDGAGQDAGPGRPGRMADHCSPKRLCDLLN